METVGFIGLGNMGSGMSRNIQRAGYPMVVYDIREEMTKPLLEGGARLASSPAEVAEQSDVTFTSLPGPKEVEAVATGPSGVLAGIKPGGIYVDLSTSRPTLIRQIEPMFRQKGAPCSRCTGERRKDRGCDQEPGCDGGGREGGLRANQTVTRCLWGQGVLRRGHRSRQRVQAGAQHDWARDTPGHRRGADPRGESGEWTRKPCGNVFDEAPSDG